MLMMMANATDNDKAHGAPTITQMKQSQANEVKKIIKDSQRMGKRKSSYCNP